MLHVGTGDVNMGLVIAPSQNGEATVYAGAMSSYYEHVTTNFKRMTDKEWEAAMHPKSAFPRPDWVNIYLADSSGTRMAEGPSLLTGIDAAPAIPPASALAPVLRAVFPNPLTTSGAIVSFTTSGADRGELSVDVFDVAGRHIRSLFRGSAPKGTYLARFDGNDDAGRPLPSGAYLLRLTTALDVATRSVTIVR